jgi:hypothetical protein
MNRPNFFIVGAPKCGTTAMNHFLRAHPRVFVPARKELHFFGSDLIVAARPSETEYLAEFAARTNEPVAGETSVYYLSSRRAAEEIERFSPAAKIIAMLRDPVDLLHSLHAQLFYTGDEDISDFLAALEAEAERKKGNRLPHHTTIRQFLFYRETVRFTEQLQRYFDVFGRDRVRVIVYDDLRRNPAAEYRRTLEFLGVDPAFAPDFAVVNPNKMARSRALQRILHSPPPWLLDAGRAFIPKAIRDSLREDLRRINTRQMPRPPLAPDLHARLAKEFAPEVARLGALIGRDLSHWSDPECRSEATVSAGLDHHAAE